MKPFNGKLIIKKEEVEEKSAGGILLGEVSKSPFIDATIVAISDSILSPTTKQEVNMPQGLEIGIKIVIQRTSGFEFKLNGEKVYIIDVSEIIGIK